MIKVFLHISVHIGTKLRELAFPGTERDTQKGGNARDLTPTGWGWGGGSGDRAGQREKRTF